ncbi:uncharacterized protein BDZ99DRAFT_568278 [Mytilinidion resinicola]|uniref:BTB domain-containing protein n=1 Tax=Mytilinidion resinicola TaxID=574789 RepID=A0A6A6YYD9_9PEZI|nr:uncharacterized protein BDZ99DRAFT_568278 [Mytilinidion resinicola]KAF2813014.1 hypothetical protein BDZ99DRAFT_568278 [Mytilinidion resinicola]
MRIPHTVRTDEKKDIRIHKGLLTYHSAFFAAALNGGFKEGETGIVELPDDEVAVFQAVYCWLYTGRLHDPPSSPLAKASSAPGPLTPEIPLTGEVICKVFVFGEMRGIPALKNEAIDLLHRFTCVMEFPTIVLHYIYENTSDESLIRKMIVEMAADFFLSCSDLTCFNTKRDLLPAGFLLDLMFKLETQDGKFKETGNTGMVNLDRCSKYHDHSGPGGKLRGSQASA